MIRRILLDEASINGLAPVGHVEEGNHMHFPASWTLTKTQAKALVAATLALIPLVGCKPVKPGPLGLGPDECAWVFTEYQPSQWESEWKKGIDSGERRDRECEILATPAEAQRSVRLIQGIRGLMEKKAVPPAESIDLFSRMVYQQVCGPAEKPTGRKRAQLIEPLIGIVRDPLSICPKPTSVPQDVYATYGTLEDDLQSKRHLLLGPASPWSELSKDPPSWRVGGFEPWTKETPSPQARVRQNMLIDMGASAFGAWKGMETFVGARWFVDRYQKLGLSFDWLVSYEYEKMDPDQIYADVPPDLLPHYIYYNKGVEKAPDGKWNPWRILRGMGVTRNDYVVVKLDIDTPEIENDLADQVLSDPRNTVLVDEFFYEHHTNTKSMHQWWHTENSTILVKDTYKNFTALRSKGVRMHSWP